MSQFEPFNFITQTGGGGGSPQQLFDEFQDLTSARVPLTDVQLLTKLRQQHPDMAITAVPTSNCNLTQFALAGKAIMELDIDTEQVVRYRGYIPAAKRDQPGDLGESINFAKFRYAWKSDVFIVYTVGSGPYQTQFILAELEDGSNPLGTNAPTDALLQAIGDWVSSDRDVVYVFDGYWRKSKDLWNEVQKASWDNVILDPAMKKELVEVADKFFDMEDVYKQFGVPWKVCACCPYTMS